MFSFFNYFMIVNLFIYLEPDSPGVCLFVYFLIYLCMDACMNVFIHFFVCFIVSFFCKTILYFTIVSLFLFQRRK